MAAAGQFRYCTSAHIGPAQLCLQAVSRQGAERNGRPRRLQQFHLSMQDCTGEARQVQLPARDTAAAADACPLLPPARCCCCTSPGSSLLTFCMAARLLGSGGGEAAAASGQETKRLRVARSQAGVWGGSEVHPAVCGLARATGSSRASKARSGERGRRIARNAARPAPPRRAPRHSACLPSPRASTTLSPQSSTHPAHRPPMSAKMQADAPAAPSGGRSDDRVVTSIDAAPMTHLHPVPDLADRIYNPGGAGLAQAGRGRRPRSAAARPPPTCAAAARPRRPLARRRCLCHCRFSAPQACHAPT